MSDLAKYLMRRSIVLFGQILLYGFFVLIGL